MDKYLRRDELPFPVDEGLYELRLLTVVNAWRGSSVAPALMYAAFRWVEARGATRVMAMGRCEVMDFYLKAGITPHGQFIQSGAVRFELMSAEIAAMRKRLQQSAKELARLQQRLEWALDVPFGEKETCFHGGAFFEAIGEDFDDLDRCYEIINADVLDAWFPPSPKVLDAVQGHLSWLMRTSPPTQCAGMVRAIAKAREVPEASILPGAGSSDLMFLALPRWLNKDSRVLILDPMYGEYAHIFNKVIRCQVDHFCLSKQNDYTVDPEALGERIVEGNYDLVVLVNPNSPTGQHVPREAMEEMLRCVPVTTRVWIDETYIDYTGPRQSLERFAAKSENVVICKSMSKVYGLSGARAAYLCGAPRIIEALREVTPPWAVSLPAQVAAVMALQDPEYYAQRYEETHWLRAQLSADLSAMGIEVSPSVASFMLCHLPAHGPNAATLITACRKQGLYLRDVANMGTCFDDKTFRIAIKDAVTNRRMVEILRKELDACAPQSVQRVRHAINAPQEPKRLIGQFA